MSLVAQQNSNVKTVFLIETAAQLTLIKLIEFKIVYQNKSNQNQQQLHRGVPWCFDSKAIGLDDPWCSVVFCCVSVVSCGVQVSLGRKDFWSCLQLWCSVVFPWCPMVFRSLVDMKNFLGLKHHGTPGRCEA
jgi:hypothetical protein